jgi:hypothetical protein
LFVYWFIEATKLYIAEKKGFIFFFRQQKNVCKVENTFHCNQALGLEEINNPAKLSTTQLSHNQNNNKRV